MQETESRPLAAYRNQVHIFKYTKLTGFMKNVKEVSDRCVDCNLCVKECAFLDTHGTPGQICDRFIHGQLIGKQTIAYQCNLCGLCQVVCPLDLNIPGAFLAMRRKLAPTLAKNLPYHRGLKFHEWIGGTLLFKLHKTPQNCDTVFFPGCGLATTRTATVEATYCYLKTHFPHLGIVLDCCSRISHDLGRRKLFEKRYYKLIRSLRKKGVRQIITACPSCHTTFKAYGEDISIRTVYEVLADNPPPNTPPLPKKLVVHDACVTRNDPVLHTAVRSILSRSGAGIMPMDHEKESTLCCSEGGGASCTAPHITDRWIAIRKAETQGKHCITYCSGCSSVFDNKGIDNTHILDLFFADNHEPKKNKEGRIRSYINRLRLKIRLLRHF